MACWNVMDLSVVLNAVEGPEDPSRRYSMSSTSSEGTASREWRSYDERSFLRGGSTPPPSWAQHSQDQLPPLIDMPHRYPQQLPSWGDFQQRLLMEDSDYRRQLPSSQCSPVLSESPSPNDRENCSSSFLPLRYIQGQRSPSSRYKRTSTQRLRLLPISRRSPQDRSGHPGPFPTFVNPPHSNKAYTQEQVDWIRYHKDDLIIKWEICLANYRVFFNDPRLSNQCLSARNYRDNRLPAVDEFWNVLRDPNGKVRWKYAKVRARPTPEMKGVDAPWKLVEKHPERAMKYAWVRPVDQRRARQILIEDQRAAEGENEMSYQAKWRRVIRIAEDMERQARMRR